jgi:enhancer of polycomb-like protein
MRKTRASQASSSEKLLRLKQELATAAELVNCVFKREQLKREVAQQGQDVWEKRGDYAFLKRKFPSLLNPKEDDELLFDKERVKKPRPAEQGYAYSLVRVCTNSYICSRLPLKIRSRDNNGELVSPTPHHDAVVRPKERNAAIVAQIDREIARIKDRDHHWEDGAEVSHRPLIIVLFLLTARRMPISLRSLPRLSDTSSGSPHPRFLDHHHQKPA